MLFPLNTLAETTKNKEEIVYSRMNLYGNIESVFVVNAFDLADRTTIVDYGNYLNVTNTTTNQEIEYNGLWSTVKDVGPGRFFYQGELASSTQLPWLIQFKYSLDGREIAAQDLAGQSGKLKIEIITKQNKNVDPVYFDNYLLTMTFNLDSKIVTNLKAEEATIANAGDQKTVVFTALPKSESTYIIEADVKDFEMGATQIAALPFSMAIELPDISQFTSGISELQNGISQLNYGASQLAYGINQLNQNGSSLASGANQLSSGANQLKDGLNQSVTGTSQFVDGINQYTGGVSQLSLGSKELVNGSVQIRDGINLLATSLNEYSSMLKLTPEQQALVNASVTALQNLKSFLQNDLSTAVFLPIAQALKRETILSIYPDLDLTNPQIVNLLNYMDLQAQAIEQSYNLLNPFQETIKTELLPKIDSMINLISGISQMGQLIDGVNQLNTQYGQFHTGLAALSDGLAQLEGSSGQLVSGGEQLKSGLNQLNQGVSDFASGVNAYSSGINQYTDGVNQLSHGANQLSSGTNQLDSATSNIDTLMEEKIQELMKDYEFEEFEMKSFVDEQNTNIKLVQFVMMTQPIQKEVVEEAVVEQEEEKSLLDLFFDLFK